MRILVLGSGGREHALSWKLAQSPLAEVVFVAPGNGGTSPNVSLDPLDFPAIGRFCAQERIDLLVVGPEAPLVRGIADFFRGSAVRVVGPGGAGARLEGSKIFAKRFMERHGVATAPFWVFDRGEDPTDLIRDLGGKAVVKYDGLAAGKGVTVCTNEAEAEAAVARLREAYGPSASFLIEPVLEGMEVSIIGFTDGETFLRLQPSQDHKRRYDGDHGPNTGGMGAYTPAAFCTPQVLDSIDRSIVTPTLEGLRREGISYHGALYFGIMLTAEGPTLLEYNVRLGDPETEAVLPALETDLVAVFCRCVEGNLAAADVRFSPDSFVDVVLVSGEYPGTCVTGVPVRGLEDLPREAIVFHAGTRRTPQGIVTAGGRVLNVVGRGSTLSEAVEAAYGLVSGITFEGCDYRRDIGRRGLR